MSNNFNSNHPEKKEGEEFLMNFAKGENIETFKQPNFEYLRKGKTAYTNSGKVVEGYFPVFFKYKFSDIKKVVGKRVKSIRKKLNISQTELSSESDVDRITISEIEKGKRNVTIDTLSKLALVLKVDVLELFK